jgi:hypothetical protein
LKPHTYLKHLLLMSCVARKVLVHLDVVLFLRLQVRICPKPALVTDKEYY